jgi:glycosyltransferase involved in cell wall biosynthesis
MSTAPRVSVLTAAYNAAPFVGSAIASILAQTYGDFEYILVDDASQDSTAAIMEHFASADRRLVVHRSTTNLNAAGALNRGLALARGEYVAILDADDIAYPARLARQVAFLDAHTTVGVVGSQVRMIDADGAGIRDLSFPLQPALARWQVLFRTPILHSAAMMRRAHVEQVGGYSTLHYTLCDYELFARLVKVAELANLPECLVAYRRSPLQISSAHRRPQRAQVCLLILAMLAERLAMRISLADAANFYDAMHGTRFSDAESLVRAREIVEAIHRRYLDAEAPDAACTDLLSADVAWRWLVMAWMHRRQDHAGSRACLRQSQRLAPDILRRPDVRLRLRQLGAPGNYAAAGASTADRKPRASR